MLIWWVSEMNKFWKFIRNSGSFDSLPNNSFSHTNFYKRSHGISSCWVPFYIHMSHRILITLYLYYSLGLRSFIIIKEAQPKRHHFVHNNKFFFYSTIIPTNSPIFSVSVPLLPMSGLAEPRKSLREYQTLCTLFILYK